MAFSVFPSSTLSIDREEWHPQTCNLTGLRLILYRRKETLVSLYHDCTLYSCSLRTEAYRLDALVVVGMPYLGMKDTLLAELVPKICTYKQQ